MSIEGCLEWDAAVKMELGGVKVSFGDAEVSDIYIAAGVNADILHLVI